MLSILREMLLMPVTEYAESLRISTWEPSAESTVVGIALEPSVCEAIPIGTMKLVAETSPLTSSVCPSDVLPIPTLPTRSTLIAGLSVPWYVERSVEVPVRAFEMSITLFCCLKADTRYGVNPA